MTKFEQAGVNYQLLSVSKEDALRNFQRSCNICCTHGMRIECDRCAIACVHNQTIACFEDEKGE